VRRHFGTLGARGSSDGVGIVVVAPLVIALGQVWRKPLLLRVWIEGVGVLGVTALAGFYCMTHETGSWLSFSPGAILFPLLLWLTARCEPTFGIAGAFIASAAVIIATTFGVGRFGDAAIPIVERVKGAQVATMFVTIYTLVLTALFAQGKKAEEGLRESERRLAKECAMLASLHEVGSRLWLKRDLRRALDEILAGAIELLGADMGIIQILDSAGDLLKIEAHRGFNQDFLDTFSKVSAAGDSSCGNALRSGERIVIADVEADKILAPFRRLARAAGFRAVQSTPIMNREGALSGTLATHFRSVYRPTAHDVGLLDLYVRQAADIIDRHRSEDALRESEERFRVSEQGFRELLGALPAAIFVTDADGRIIYYNQAAVDMWGKRPELGKDRWSDLARFYFADGKPAILRECPTEVALRKGRSVRGCEAILERPDGTRTPILPYPTPLRDATGAIVGVVNMTVDITERKELEDHKNTLISELDHRVKNVLAIVSTVVSRTQETSSSMAEFVAALDGRIKSMATAHELLSCRRWQGIPLAELVHRELAPYATANNTRIGGPDVVLCAEAGQTLAMVFHKLATNAAKFGAISAKAGRVSVRWSVMRNGHAESWLCIHWEESGGPRVVPPTRSGFGTSVVRELVPYELAGTADIMHLPDGVGCKLSFRRIGSAPATAREISIILDDLAQPDLNVTQGTSIDSPFPTMVCTAAVACVPAGSGWRPPGSVAILPVVFPTHLARVRCSILNIGRVAL
jgi:PAS domain S-box-containing protein